MIAFLTLPVLVTIAIPFLKVKGKGIVAISVIFINSIISCYFAIQTLSGQVFDLSLPGNVVTGPIRIYLDALSGWFLLIINFIFLTGGFYGLYYMKAYREQRKNLSLHSIAFVLLHTALISICAIQNSLIFLIAWETMAISAFIAVIFESGKMATLKAGINFLVQSHISILFLMLGFIWVAYKTGSFDFQSITTYTETHQGATGMILFFCFFIGFAIKAGFVPFHTWLPHAHPAAPTHISGIMSGVIIKIGIFGILRMLLLIKMDYTVVGYFILLVSVISGLYGVMLAIIQHNLKKLLAYHSIENIGIIGMGIGIGCIGLGNGNPLLAALGFAGALLHTLNHALFKSLLFYTAGIVYQATHTLNIENLGGLIKKMPQTAILFLIAAIAICGIPPFNGFVSEFLIYNGLYQWMLNADIVPLVAIIFSVLALVLIGGLALFCFTKAFGIVFLGQPRKKINHEIKESPFFQWLPLYLIALTILCIGLFPQPFLNVLTKPVNLYSGLIQPSLVPFQDEIAHTVQPIGLASGVFILLIALVFSVRKIMIRNREITVSPTWGCGYVAPQPKIQYTASSFVRTYSKLFNPFLLFEKKEKNVSGVFPVEAHYKSHPYDRIESWFVDKPIKAIKSFLSRFLFLNNGKLQFSILYGIIFIVSVICIPFLYDTIMAFIDFLKQL
ncbi:MAG TPA: proton-conducting transporter membrane subunit [Prolixibacteraceae bacterium]|nr:proton-conducting transporter membrane subunit [Prolixibacteraceae bacterium]